MKAATKNGNNLLSSIKELFGWKGNVRIEEGCMMFSNFEASILHIKRFYQQLPS